MAIFGEFHGIRLAQLKPRVRPHRKARFRSVSPMLDFWFREFTYGDAAEQPTEYALLKVA
jgi:hypothetical protein